MKRIISVFIALLALNLLMPTILGMAPLLVSSPSKNLSIAPNNPLGVKSHEVAWQALYTTPTIASFLNETWIPGMPINNTETYSPTSIYPGPGVLGGDAPGSIIGFLAANDTIPTTTAPPVEVAQSYSGTAVFKFHQMN